MSGWYQGRVTLTERAAEGLFRVHVDVGAGAPSDGHSRPGQYLRLRIPELGPSEGTFAIASAPRDTDDYELLVKAGSDVSDHLIAAGVGTGVELCGPEGPGFPLEAARGRRVLLFATGSGISAIRSLIEAVRKDRDAYREVTLYFGARTPDAFAYRDELDAWERSGIKVVRTVSQYGHPGWEGLYGYVQAHLPPERLQDAVAFLCGQEEMAAAVKQALRQRGMAPEDMFQNV